MKKLKWNDPDPIEGNDYIIDTVEGVKASTILMVLSILDQKEEGISISDAAEYPLHITFGGGSKAEVTLGELEEVEIEERKCQRYLSFYGEVYYPRQGMENLVGDYNSIDEAIESINKAHEEDSPGVWDYNWAIVWDSVEKKEIYNVHDDLD